jgi:dihydroorotate dehydrogenase
MFYALPRAALFALDPETAHHLALKSLQALQRMRLIGRNPPAPASCARPVMGLDFPNPVGLAAGLDKNGAYIDALAALGFGFIEVGTVTPRAQPGNPRPRLFRLPEVDALINRMGFNNQGVDRLVENVRRSTWRGVLGINIGKNFQTPIERAADDYVECLRKVYELASYVTVNISSPNTRGLRALQGADHLDTLLATLAEERERLADRHSKRVPLAVKIAPDLNETEIVAIAERLRRYGIDAVIATNTTVTRDGVGALPHASEAGGLSGAPLTAKATNVIAKLSRELGSSVPIIGVGGIMTATDALAKIASGAALVQLYTGLIYAGPRLVKDCIAALCARSSTGLS